MNRNARGPWRSWLAALMLVAPLAPLAQGCAAAAVGAAGAAAGIAYTHRGTKSEVQGSLPDVDRRAVAVFDNLGIVPTESKHTSKKNSLTGKKGDLEVTVQMKASGPDYTNVEVVAHRSTIKYDKDYAKQVMQRIISQA